MSASILALVLGLSACTNGDPLIPPTLRFGQVGEIRLSVSTPLGAPGGLLQQSMTWRSDGAWQLDEEMMYRGRSGGRERKTPLGNQGAYASSYATLIAQVNETPGLELFISGLDPALEPDCGTGRATVVLEITDTGRQEAARWTRCGTGPLAALGPQGAGPDLNAARVISAAAAMRDLTLGSSYRSPFLGSLPFATLDRGEDSGVALTQPLIFLPVIRSNGTRSGLPPVGRGILELPYPGAEAAPFRGLGGIRWSWWGRWGFAPRQGDRAVQVQAESSPVTNGGHRDLVERGSRAISASPGQTERSITSTSWSEPAPIQISASGTWWWRRVPLSDSDGVSHGSDVGMSLIRAFSLVFVFFSLVCTALGGLIAWRSQQGAGGGVVTRTPAGWRGHAAEVGLRFPIPRTPALVSEYTLDDSPSRAAVRRLQDAGPASLHIS